MSFSSGGRILPGRFIENSDHSNPLLYWKTKCLTLDGHQFYHVVDYKSTFVVQVYDIQKERHCFFTLDTLPPGFPSGFSCYSVHLSSPTRIYMLVKSQQQTNDFYIAIFNLNFETKKLELQKYAPFVTDQHPLRNCKICIFDKAIVCFSHWNWRMNFYELDLNGNRLIEQRKSIQVQQRHELGIKPYARFDEATKLLTYFPHMHPRYWTFMSASTRYVRVNFGSEKVDEINLEMTTKQELAFYIRKYSEASNQDSLIKWDSRGRWHKNCFYYVVSPRSKDQTLPSVLIVLDMDTKKWSPVPYILQNVYLYSVFSCFPEATGVLMVVGANKNNKSQVYRVGLGRPDILLNLCISASKLSRSNKFLCQIIG